MSPRAACRLESLGFRDVYDYGPGKVDWLARGLPTEGEAAAELRAGDVARDDAAACRPDEAAGEVAGRIAASPYGFALVLSPGRVLLGRLRRSAIDEGDTRPAEELMEPGPVTIRAHAPAARVHERLQRHDLRTAVVTTPDGELVGVFSREEAGPRPGR